MIKLRAWDNFNAEMIYSDKYDNLQDFFYDVKRRENGGNKVSLMLQSKCNDHDGRSIYEGHIIEFKHGSDTRIGIVKCRPDPLCYWQIHVLGDHFGLGWVLNCCARVQVIGNRYADREWLEDEGLGGLLDEAEKTTNPWFESATLKKLAATAERKTETQDIERKALSEEAEKFRAFSTEKWAREYSKIHFEPKPTPKPARIESGYNDDFGRKIKEGDILIFKLCGRRFTGEVLKIFSPETAKSSWQVWTYDSPGMKLSLLHVCEDIACTEVRVIGHISTVRQGGVAVQDIGIQL